MRRHRQGGVLRGKAVDIPPYSIGRNLIHLDNTISIRNTPVVHCLQAFLLRLFRYLFHLDSSFFNKSLEFFIPAAYVRIRYDYRIDIVHFIGTRLRVLDWRFRMDCVARTQIRRNHLLKARRALPLRPRLATSARKMTPMITSPTKNGFRKRTPCVLMRNRNTTIFFTNRTRHVCIRGLPTPS